MKPALKVFLMALAYFAIFLMGSASGAIHPACFAYFGALLPFLSALVYLNTTTVIRGFGAAAILNGFILLVGWATGEADLTFLIGLLILTALAELIRFIFKYDTLKGIHWSFVPFALSFFAYTAHWWTDTEGSLAAALEVMRPGYDQLMIPVIDNETVMVIVVLATIPLSILAMKLAERALKKQIAILK